MGIIERINEINYSKTSTKKLVKIYKQMADERLSGSSALTFRLIAKELIKRKAKLESINEVRWPDNQTSRLLAQAFKDAKVRVSKVWEKGNHKYIIRVRAIDGDVNVKMELNVVSNVITLDTQSGHVRLGELQPGSRGRKLSKNLKMLSKLPSFGVAGFKGLKYKIESINEAKEIKFHQIQPKDYIWYRGGIQYFVTKTGPNVLHMGLVNKGKPGSGGSLFASNTKLTRKNFDSQIRVKFIKKITRDKNTLWQESVNEATDWMLKLDIGKNKPNEFKKWASPQLQKKHKIKVRGGGKKWIIVGDEKKGSSSDWIKQLLDKAWRINKIKTQQIESVNEAVKEAKFSKDQMEIMRTAFGTLKRMNPSSPTYKKFIKFLDRLPKDELKQLAGANIKFISMLAKNRLRGESTNEAKPKLQSFKFKFKCMECGKSFIKSLRRSLEVKCPKCKSVDIELENINETLNEGFEKYHLGGLLDSKLKKRLERAIKLWSGKVDAVGDDYIKFRMSSSDVSRFPALLKKLDHNKNVWIGDKRKKNIWDRRKNIDKLREESKRDYRAEYKKFQSSPKAKKYRAELNKYNRKKGTYGNGDGKDASHKGGKIVGFESQSKNRGRREKSRLKKEGFGGQLNAKDLKQFEKQRKENAEVLGYTVTGVSDVKETTLEVNPKEKGNKNEDNK